MSGHTAPTIKVFALDDIEWWAGESLKSCLEEARRQAGADCYPESSDQHEVSDEAMQVLIFEDEDGTRRTFAEQLLREIASGASFPCIFAATEW